MVKSPMDRYADRNKLAGRFGGETGLDLVVPRLSVIPVSELRRKRSTRGRRRTGLEGSITSRPSTGAAESGEGQRMPHVEERAPLRLGLTPDTWRIIGYVRDLVIILGILFGAMYFSEHPEKFDAFLYWAIGHYYRH
jgi:hypothetical protein